VAKWQGGRYQTDGGTRSWLKIRNPDYTQMRDRHALFERRHAEPPGGRTLVRPDALR
jgi:hypothetical protein